MILEYEPASEPLHISVLYHLDLARQLIAKLEPVLDSKVCVRESDRSGS